jgi:hypothetical protein
MLRIIFALSFPIIVKVMQFYCSPNPLYVCIFSVNVNSNASHLLSPVLLAQNCHRHIQNVETFHYSRTSHFDPHCQDQHTNDCTSVASCSPGFLQPQWNFQQSCAHKLCVFIAFTISTIPNPASLSP